MGMTGGLSAPHSHRHGCGDLLYFYWVRSSTVRYVPGICFLMKLLIEIWGQHTPTWVCPNQWVLFFLVYVVGIPWVIGVYGYCTKVEDIVFSSRDALGLVLFLFGSSYSLSYEAHRFLSPATEKSQETFDRIISELRHGERSEPEIFPRAGS